MCTAACGGSVGGLGPPAPASDSGASAPQPAEKVGEEVQSVVDAGDDAPEMEAAPTPAPMATGTPSPPACESVCSGCCVANVCVACPPDVVVGQPAPLEAGVVGVDVAVPDARALGPVIGFDCLTATYGVQSCSAYIGALGVRCGIAISPSGSECVLGAACQVGSEFGTCAP